MAPKQSFVDWYSRLRGFKFQIHYLIINRTGSICQSEMGRSVIGNSPCSRRHLRLLRIQPMGIVRWFHFDTLVCTCIADRGCAVALTLISVGHDDSLARDQGLDLRAIKTQWGNGTFKILMCYKVECSFLRDRPDGGSLVEFSMIVNS